MSPIILLLIMLSITGRQPLENARRATLPQSDIWGGFNDRLYAPCPNVERAVITDKVSEEFFGES